MAIQLEPTDKAAKPLDLDEYQSRLDRPVLLKRPDFLQHERLKHVIFSDQFDRDLLEDLAALADKIRVLAKTKEGYLFLNHLLAHKRAMLYFTQPSTRTFLSFMAACQIMGLTCNEVRDATTSSETKGESRLDSIRMFSSYFDVIIMRSRFERLAESCAYLMNDLEEHGQRGVPIINGGSGKDEHPTQALLDVYTLQRTFHFLANRPPNVAGRSTAPQAELAPGLANKTYGFCGDIGRGRTIRSLASLLSQYENNTLIFIAPNDATLSLRPKMRDKLVEAGAQVYEVDSFEERVQGAKVIESIDALYMTRIQDEHDSAEDAKRRRNIDFSKYKLSLELVQRMKEHAPILHPFPRNEKFGEIPPEVDSDPRATYFRQARNGMWIRAALLAHLFSVERHIVREYEKRSRERHDYNDET